MYEEIKNSVQSYCNCAPAGDICFSTISNKFKNYCVRWNDVNDIFLQHTCNVLYYHLDL